MKKTICCLLTVLLSVFLWNSSVGFAEGHLTGFIAASSSDRVHLRADQSSSSPSKGLYFSGTPVVLPSGSGYSEWTAVVIGAETGFIHSSLLADTQNSHERSCEWKAATVTASGFVNVRSAPAKEAPVLLKAKEGETLAVLGETAQHWYYVRYQDTYGYVMSRYLHLTGERWPVRQSASVLPFPESIDCFWASGAGAWSTQMEIMHDGSFLGYFQDSDMGVVGEGYPHGTFYECSFAGRFDNLVRVSEWEYQMEVASLQIFGIEGQETICDQTLVITTDSYGITEGETFSLFLAGAPQSALPANCIQEYQPTANGFLLLYGHKSESDWWLD